MAAACLFAACSKTPTQLLVIADSDLQVPSELAAIRAVLRDEGGVEKRAHRFVLGAGGVSLPISFGAGPGESESLRVMIDLEAIAPDDRVLFTRRVITAFVEGKSLVLPVFLAARCATLTCNDGTTCGENGCVSPEIDPGSLCEDGSDACSGPLPGDAGVIGEDAPDLGFEDVPPIDRGVEDALGEDAVEQPDLGVEDTGVVQPDAEIDGGVVEVDAGPQAPQNTAPPFITGDPFESRLVLADPGEWTFTGQIRFTYQWQLCDLSLSCTDIGGATSNTYTPLRAQIDQRLRVAVVATDDAGFTVAETAISAPIRPATPVEPIFIAGFESGLTASSAEPGDTISAGATVMNIAARSGNYGLRTEYLSPLGTPGGFVKNFPPAPVLVARFAFKLTGTFAMQGVVIARIQGSEAMIVAYNPANQQIALVRFNNPAPVYGPVIANDEWVLVDVRLEDNFGASTFSWRVNAVEQVPVASMGGTTGGGVTAIGFGENSSGGFAVDFDDIALSVNAADFPMGDASIERILPNASGNHVTPQGAFVDQNNQVVLMGEMTSWQLIDDFPVNSNPSDYVRPEIRFPGIGYLEYAFADPPRTPNSLRILTSLGAMPPEPPHAHLEVHFSGAQHVYEAVNSDTAGASRWFFSRMIPRDTPNGMPWTAAALADLRVRFSASQMSNGRSWLEAVMFEAEYPRQ